MNTVKLYQGNIFTVMAVLAYTVIIVTAFLHFQNNHLKVTRYVYSSSELPAVFRGFRIRQISDYHNTRDMEHRIISRTLAEKPDIIVITGDLFDCRKTDVAAGLSLAKKLVKIAPVYMVCGNHEAKIKDIDEIKDALSTLGVNIVENEKVIITRETESITLCGLQDPQFTAKGEKGDSEARKKAFCNYVMNFMSGTEGFVLLLSHRPEYVHTYRDCGVNLALTGHAHGGQFGIPFTDIGVFVPNQGLFPKYAAGYKNLDDTTMIISRGIGNSVFPFRLLNYPEIVTVEFE